MRGADHDDVADDERRRVEAQLRGVEIDFLIHLQLQIDDAVLPEARNGLPVLASSAFIR